MQNLNWWLMALAFILGFVAFLLLTVRKRSPVRCR